MNQPVVTLLIGTRNRLELIKKCLGSIVGQTKCVCRIIVIDAGSTDGTIEYIKSIKEVELIEDGEPIGQAQSLNRVIPSVTSKYVCWLSDDNEVKPDAIENAIDILEQNYRIGMVALKVRDVTGGREHKAYIGGLRSSGIITCNQGMLRTDLMKEVGGFDEDFIDYGIDVDLTAKILLSNKSVVLTKKVSVLHHRDHHGSPGAITGDRAFKIKRSYDLFSMKYPELERYSKVEIFRKIFWGTVWKLIEKLSSFVMTKPYVTNEKLLNCYNILNGRYVSKFDWICSRNKKYYIVQSISKSKV